MAVSQPYEVISSEDMLARIQKCNKEIDKLRLEKNMNVAGDECSKAELSQDAKQGSDSWDW